MCSAATVADIYHTDPLYHVAAIRKVQAHWNHEMHRAAHPSCRHPEWEPGCQRFVRRTRPVDVMTSQMSSIGVYDPASKKIETRMGINPCTRAAPGLRQILVALLLILTLSSFGDAEKADQRKLQRCGVSLVWTGVACGSSSEPQAKIKERSRSACNLCSTDPTSAHCRCNSPTRSCNDERCMLEAKTLPQMFGLIDFSPSCNQFCANT